MSDAALRGELVRVAHECARRELVVAGQGNLSARAGAGCVVSARGARLETLSERDLIEIAADGHPAADAGARPSSEWRVHLAIYAARPDVGAVVHTHSTHAAAWSHLGEDLDTGGKEAGAALGGAVRTAPAAPAASPELATVVVSVLGPRAAVLLPGHGVVGVGATPAGALDSCLIVERQAAIAWLLRAR